MTNSTLLWFGVLGVLESVLGSCGNTLTLCYFLTKKTWTVSTLLYLAINISDLLICLMMVPVGVANLKNNEGGGWFSDTSFCALWGITWSVSIRMSVYSIGLLSITRTLSLIRPLRRIPVRHVSNLLGIYLVILILQGLLPFFYKKGYYYSRKSQMCVWELAEVYKPLSSEFKIVFFISTVLEFILPALPIIASCFITVMKLRTSSCAEEPGVNQQSVCKIRATVTVVALTVAYVVFNVPLCIILGQHAMFLFCGGCFTPVETYHSLEIFFSTHVFALNAITNVIIYFSRIKDMQQFLINFRSRTMNLRLTTANLNSELN